MEDDELISAALAGRSDSFGELVLRYQDRLFNSLSHMLGSADDARDVVQDALVQAFVKLESFHGASSFYTWLYRIAMNQAISRRRRERPRRSLDLAREAGDEPTAAGDAPGDRMERAERAQQVQAALAALSSEHRSILVLREVEGFDYEKIAEILDLPAGTVRSRLHRARLQLRDELKNVWQEERR